ncbi:MAG: hypothetical protein J5999_01060 [Oscillospiraceae bacterium]|nr:hypothetical protein [Oscillospiraceae bacterium]
MEDKVLCPLIDKEISCVDCMENRDVKDENIPDIFKKKDNWKDICQNCKHFTK